MIKSTISRFCRQIGYENYYELNQDLYTSTTKSQDKYDKYLLDDFENTKDIFFKDLINSILDAKNSITKKSAFTLVSLIKEYDDIIYLSCPDNYASRAHIMSFYLNMVAIEYANTK